MSDDFVSGQRLVMIQYGRFEDLVAGTKTGPLRVVGSELTFVRRQGQTLFVRDIRGEEGFLYPDSVSAFDPRVFFTVEGMDHLTGYIVGGLCDDQSGGSLYWVSLEGVEGLGGIEVAADTIDAIDITAAGSMELRTTTDQVYRCHAKRIWLICPTLRLNLAKVSGVRLRRVTATTTLAVGACHIETETTLEIRERIPVED